MQTDNKPQYKEILGIDEGIQPIENSSSKLVNWTVDVKSKGWDNRIGYESLIPRVETRSNWAGFQNGGPVNSVYFWNTHQGAKSWLLYEQAFADTVAKTFPADANANMSLHYWKGNTLQNALVDNKRSVQANDEIYTHYTPLGKNLVILSGNGRPLKFDGVKTTTLGFLEAPNPPIPWYVNGDILNAAIADQTVMPINAHSFNMDKSYGVGDPTAYAENRYRYKVSFIMENGSESPLSAASVHTYWETFSNAAPAYADFNDRRVAIYLENVPLGPEGCIARKIYRTKNLTDGNTIEEIFYYCDTITNNNETNYVDYTKDTRLGSVAPDDDASILFPAPSTRFSATYKNCLFLDGGQADPTRIYYSQPLKPDQFRALDFFDVGSRTGGDVTGLFTYYNNLLVFRENAIDLVRGDVLTGFTITPFVQGIGTRAIHSIALIPEAGVMFLSPDGVFLISGDSETGSEMTCTKISGPIVNTISRISKSMIARACGAYSEKWREYHLYFSVDGSPVNNLGLVFHMEKKSWSTREGFPVGCITVDARGELIFGHNVGQTVGAPFPTAGMAPAETGLFFISRCRNAGHTFTYNPAVLQNPAYYTIQEKGPPVSTWIGANLNFGIGQLKKHVKQVYLNCFTEGSNTYNVFYNKDWDYNYTQSNFGLAQRPEYVEQNFYNASTGKFVYSPPSNVNQIAAKWEIPFYTQLKFPVANMAASTFSVGIQTSNDFILIDYSLEFNASGTETKAARPKSAY